MLFIFNLILYLQIINSKDFIMNNKIYKFIQGHNHPNDF